MIDFHKIEAIIWDWNGTLLNDVDPCLASMNQMLISRNYPMISEERYKDIFTFPVKEYYLKAGIDLTIHDWDVVAHEFIDLYRRSVVNSNLHTHAMHVLTHLKNSGFRQFVLSAMQQDFLLTTILERINEQIFEKISGLDNHYAHTKEAIGMDLIKEIGLPKEHLLMIGDTLHDFEVAQALGIGCVLFSGGHQSKERLEKTGTLVIDSLIQIEGLF